MAKNHGKQNFRWLTFPAQPFSIFPAFTCMNKFRLHVLYVRPAPLCPLPSFSFHHFQFFLLYTLCLVKFISLFIHTWLDNATEHERRQENRAQVLYYTESESFPVGCCQGWGLRKWEMGKSLSRGKSLNPPSQTGVALANGN